MTASHRVSMCLAMALSTLANAQELEQKPGEVEFALHLGGGYRFNTDLEGGGDVAVARLLGAIESKIQLSRGWSMEMKFDYIYDQYDFSPITRFGGIRPWDDVHTFDAVINFEWAVAQDWTLFMGPVFQLSAEDGADLTDSLAGGGFAGVVYRFSDSLTFGGGLALTTQIEDDILVLPLLVLHWQIRDNLRLSTRPATGATGFYFILELVYDLGGSWEVAVGGAWERRRFRLTGGDSAPMPNGVGQTSGLPVWLRLSKRWGNGLEIELFGGFSFNGEYELYNSSGDSRGALDIDPQPFLSGFLTWRF